MKSSTYVVTAILLLCSFSIMSLACGSQARTSQWNWWGNKEKPLKVKQQISTDTPKLQTQKKEPESELDKEVRRVMERGGALEERKRQIPAIAATFARRTEPQRARYLSALCYLATLGTPFMPIDIAEIALAETGSHGLSGKKSSPKGALGVWQLMPSRAKSHGYSPKDMENDQKCADAAVHELTAKLAMANGNLKRAKKLYCGIGQEADAYELKRQQFRKEILENLSNPQLGKDDLVQLNEHPLQIHASLIDQQF